VKSAKNNAIDDSAFLFSPLDAQYVYQSTVHESFLIVKSSNMSTSCRGTQEERA
jgi:hypothetical protein